MKYFLLFALSLTLLMDSARSQNPSPLPERRAKADKLMKEGNWKDALEIWRNVLEDPKHGGRELAEDFGRAVQCQAHLGQFVHFDDLLEKSVAAHPQDWRLMTAAADSLLNQGQHWGTIIENKFQRGTHGTGKHVSAVDRDRVRALQLYEQAMKAVSAKDADQPAADVGAFYQQFATMMLRRESWELQALTDLSKLPDYDEAMNHMHGWGGRRFGRGHGMYPGGALASDRGAPVDEKGDPVFHKTPETWEKATSDGERWRWLLAQRAKFGPDGAFHADLALAQFLTAEFDVHTMAQWWRPMTEDDQAGRINSLLAIHTLTDEETTARLATGVKRFKLPEEFNFIKIYQRLAESKPEFKNTPYSALGSIFQNRRQLSRAAEMWDKAGNHHQRDQIVKNWCRFDASLVQAPGEGAKVGVVFRNGTKLSSRARKIDFNKLLTDVKAYLSSNPESMDHNKINIQQIGYSILQAHMEKYIGKEVATWDTEVKPKPDHWDRRIDLSTPLQTPGAYLLETTINKGNTSAIIVWIADTAIVKKPGVNEVQYYVVDSVTGAPVAKANLEFFGYRTDYLPAEKQRGKRQMNITTRNFAEFTDKDGAYFGTKERFKTGEHYQWIITATTPQGRFAHLGFTGIWMADRQPDFYEQTKIHVMTDRPVYRPGQEVKWKAWIRRANYDAPIDKSEFADEKFNVVINDAKGQKVMDQQFTTDAFGGINGEFKLGADASLGQYAFQIHGGKENRGFMQQGNFRVEEYKKPEFEVIVEAPKEPKMLGEKITAKVMAKYYFGAPVVNGKVKYKVMRSSHDARWFPVRPWDWFYGPGYWWYCSDYAWYPGWKHWGCEGPVWWWWGHMADPPELVLENEAAIGPDGSVQIEIDTSLAKEIHGDEDHRYEINVEVTDESRRTIVGSGQVLVARQPFKVNLWTDRGHYEVGQPIQVGLKALTLDKQGVKGTGKVSLMKISYNAKGEPQEKAVITENFKTDEEGSANLKFSATQAGQYRVSAKVTDAKDHTIEGGYVFVVRGQGFDGRDFRFAQLELVPDKAEYAPGDEVKLMLNTERADSTVYYFVRSQGVAPRPQVLRIEGKSTQQMIKIEVGDMPNFFVEAFTVSNGKVHQTTREIIVPPAKRVLNLEVLADSAKHKPQEKAKVKIKLTDLDGKPFIGSTVVTVYDKALEYISGGSNVPNIKEYFWKWRRHFHQQMENNLSGSFQNMPVPLNSPGMGNIGIFGQMIADLDLGDDERPEDGKERKGAGRGKGNLSAGRNGKKLAEFGAAPAPMAEAAPDLGLAEGFADAASADKLASSIGAAPPAQPPVMIRSNFADSIFWTASLMTNADGIAEIEVPLPDNLTTWKIKSWGVGHGTRVGEGEAEIITSKDLILRQQAPRFFVEKDEVVLSANVHNYLPGAKEVTVSLELDGSCLEAMAGQELKRVIKLESQKEQRVDWRVKAVHEGTAIVRMKAITDTDSDAMEMKYPVFVHGMLKTESFSGAIRNEQTVGKIEFNVPNERRPEQSRLEIRYSPTIATAIVDAIPYLAEYPHGCTEQTLNRFLPAVLAHKTLVDMGIDLAAVEKKRTNLNPQEIGDDKERAKQWKDKHIRSNPLFHAAEYQLIVKQGVEKLTAMQNGDGGWGWFAGDREQSYPHTTAVVVHGLLAAKGADLAIVPGVIERGLAWLKRHEQHEIEQIKLWMKTEDKRGKPSANEMDAFVHMVLTEGDSVNAEMRDFLYRDRNKLQVYAKACYGLALTLQKQVEKRDMLLKNIEQYLVKDPENQTARLDLRNGNYWWWWYGSEFEAEAFYLKMLVRIDPKSDTASGLVKFLVNNRKNATYWNSTRDTAYVLEALNDYLKFTKEAEPDVKVEVLVDGKVQKEVQITKENLFSYDNVLLLTGNAVTAGKHTVEVRKTGKSPIYFNAYLTNFTLEDRITKAGLEVKIDRKYYKLTQRKDAKTLVSGARGQAIDQKVLKYDRELIPDGKELKSGDLIEVDLTIDSKNDYEYLLFEDMKPAGFESVEVRSGYTYEGLGAYREFRDERVCFYVRALPLGKHTLTYQLRAEVPGKFSALPAKASAMYAPELRGNSDEMKIGVGD